MPPKEAATNTFTSQSASTDTAFYCCDRAIAVAENPLLFLLLFFLLALEEASSNICESEDRLQRLLTQTGAPWHVGSAQARR